MDTATDGSNCGECGHSCQGGECADGVCQFVELAADQAPVVGLTQRLILDDANVYWVNVDSVSPTGQLSTSIRRVSKSGGAVQTIVPSTQPEIASFAVTGNEIFWGTNGNLRGSTLTAGQINALASSSSSIGMIDISAGFVYWVLNDQSVLQRPTGFAASSPVSLLNQTTMQSVLGMRVVGDCVYYAGGSPVLGGTAIRRVCLGSTGGDDLFRTMSTSINGFDADRSGVFFLLGSGAIFQVSLAPGQVEVPVLQSATAKDGLALDDAFIYFVETANDAIWRVSKTGSAVAEVFAEPVVRGAQPESVVVDRAAVYWADEDRILKKAK